jgi:ubiquinone/menaquinone biosynthesis C-methylase UbiE
MAAPHYVIRGGIEGRERLRILARVMRPSTLNLFERVGIASGASCLDVGCGGGDVSFELARLVGPQGRVVGVDLDEAKLETARSEARASELDNVEFHCCVVGEGRLEGAFDVAYCRFLLTHLRDPLTAVREIRKALRPGGLLMTVDIDCRGYFTCPETEGQKRFLHLYTEAVRRRGGDPDIGPRLPGLMMDSGFENVQMNVVHPAGLDGEVKLIGPITLENITEVVTAENLASAEEIRALIAEMYEYARNRRTIGSIPRIVEAWGTTPN